MHTLEDYEFIKKIGSGSSGKVYMAIYKPLNAYVAIKMISTYLRSEKRIKGEIDTLTSLQGSRFSIQLFTIIKHENNIYLVMEYVRGGDLHTYLSKCNELSLAEVRFIICELVLALEDIHRNNFIHRDLKMENILITSTGYLKICDFGLSKKLSHSLERAYSICGTKGFIAPEVFSKKGYSKNVDIWSFGSIISEILNLCEEKKSKSYQSLLNLVDSMLDIDSEQRISISEIKNHAFLNGIHWPLLENCKYISPLDFMLK